MSSKPKHEDQDSSWGSCPTGALVNMASRLSSDRGRQRRQRIFSVYGVLLVAAVVGIGGGYLLRMAPMAAPDGLTCAECVRQMAAYYDGVLDAKLTQQVKTHLGACDNCRQLYETKYSAERVQVTTSLAMSSPRWADERSFSP